MSMKRIAQGDRPAQGRAAPEPRSGTANAEVAEIVVNG
jgi:hypothetical protein